MLFNCGSLLTGDLNYFLSVLGTLLHRNLLLRSEEILLRKDNGCFLDVAFSLSLGIEGFRCTQLLSISLCMNFKSLLVLLFSVYELSCSLTLCYKFFEDVMCNLHSNVIVNVIVYSLPS